MLGQFPAFLFGRLTVLRGEFDLHKVATDAHGAISSATPNAIIRRDANGRAQVADPAASGDIATRGWVLAQGFTGGSGTVSQVATGTGLTGGPINTTGTISIANSGATPGTYNYPTLTVNAQGQITAIANGAAPVTNISTAAPLTTTGGSTPTLGIVAASGAANGYMSSTDKTKLDGIAAGAQVNSISSVFGRTGAISANAGDYTIQKISGFTVSTAAPSGGVDGDVWIQVL